MIDAAKATTFGITTTDIVRRSNATWRRNERRTVCVEGPSEDGTARALSSPWRSCINKGMRMPELLVYYNIFYIIYQIQPEATS